jgi:hypothetical protein
MPAVPTSTTDHPPLHRRQVLQVDAAFELGGLADGVSVDDAADILYVMLSSRVCHLLMDHLAWDAERYRAFLHEVVASQILR